MDRQGTTFTEGMYSKLIDSTDHSIPKDTDVYEQHMVRVSPIRGNSRQPYRLVAACLSALCLLLLLVCLVMIGLHAKTQNRSDSTPISQNITELSKQIQRLQEEKKRLEKVNGKATGEEKTPEKQIATTASPTAVLTTTGVAVDCPEGWLKFNNTCYYISTTRKSWRISQKYCQREGGHLAIVLSPEEQTFIWNHLERAHWNPYWIGITDEANEDTWHWVDGTELVGGFWEDGEPNNHIDEDCCYIVKTRVLSRTALKSWYDAPCEMACYFVCEKSI